MSGFESITHIDDLETQKRLFKAAFKLNFLNHLPTEYELKHIPNSEDVEPKTIIKNLLMILNSYSGRNILYAYVDVVRDILIKIKEIFEIEEYYKKYKNLKRLLKRIITLFNVRIQYNNDSKISYISSVNKNFDEAITQNTAKDLYDAILSRLQRVEHIPKDKNDIIYKAFKIYNKISRRDAGEEEYDKCREFIKKTVPKDFYIMDSDRVDYPRTLNNYLNNMDNNNTKEETKEETKEKTKEEQHKNILDEETQKAMDEFDNIFSAEQFNKPSTNYNKSYSIEFVYAEISGDEDVINRDDIKKLQRKIYNSDGLTEEQIKEDIKRNIQKNTLIQQLTHYDFTITPAKTAKNEEYHANINNDCLKVALKCYNIDFDGDFKELLKHEEILNKIRFDNVYGGRIRGNVRAQNRILLYNSHAVAINTNYKRNIRNDNTKITVDANTFNDILNNAYKNNIPIRCFNNDVNKGSFEIFKTDSDFNDYNKVIQGEWVKYSYNIDNEDINDYKYFCGETKEDYETYYKALDDDKDTMKSLEIDESKLNNLIIESKDNTEQMAEARKELNNLMKWFNEYIFNQCKLIDIEWSKDDEGNQRKKPLTDEQIIKNMYKIIPPVFPYEYRKRCSYTYYNRETEYFERTFKVIDMKHAFLTAFETMNTIFSISNIPLKEISKPVDNYIIYVKSNILYNGFYEGRFMNIIKKCDPNATFEYYNIYKAFPINTKEITLKEYKIVIGMLISGGKYYTYNDAINTNIDINEIRADYDYRALLHINIMIRRNTILLKEIAKQILYYNNIPRGYVVDSILFDDDADIKDISAEFKKPCDICKYNDFDISESIQSPIKYNFGVAGSGKTTILLDRYRDNETVIINNYNLLSMYYNRNVEAKLWDVFLSEHQPIYATKIYVDEIFTYQNSSIELLFYMSGINQVELSLYGDYNQLKPIETGYFIDNFSLLHHVEHNYLYTNYRNCFDYKNKDSWILNFNNTDDLLKKRKRAVDKLIKLGYVKITNEDKTIRYYKADAVQNAKTYKGKYYMLNNYSANSKIPPYVKKLFQTDVLYTIEEIEERAGLIFNKVFKYFVNNISKIYSMKLETTRLKEEQVSLEEEHKELEKDIKKLNDPDYITKYVREKYLYSKDGEIILRIDE